MYLLSNITVWWIDIYSNNSYTIYNIHIQPEDGHYQVLKHVVIYVINIIYIYIYIYLHQTVVLDSRYAPILVYSVSMSESY